MVRPGDRKGTKRDLHSERNQGTCVDEGGDSAEKPVVR